MFYKFILIIGFNFFVWQITLGSLEFNGSFEDNCFNPVVFILINSRPWLLSLHPGRFLHRSLWFTYLRISLTGHFDPCSIIIKCLELGTLPVDLRSLNWYTVALKTGLINMTSHFDNTGLHLGIKSCFGISLDRDILKWELMRRVRFIVHGDSLVDTSNLHFDGLWFFSRYWTIWVLTFSVTHMFIFLLFDTVKPILSFFPIFLESFTLGHRGF